MRFPATNKQGRRRVNIPEFTGGLNLRDNPTQCNDNQLIDMLNMWYQDGALRTRPGFNSSENMLTKTSGATDRSFQNLRFWDEISYESGSKRYIVTTLQLVTGDETIGYEARIHFRWQGEKEIIDLPTLAISLTENEYLPYFVVEKSGVLYCFTGNCVVNKLEYEKGAAEWSEVGEEEYHVPVVYTHCKQTDNSPEDMPAYMRSVGFSGTQLEGFNLLGTRYKMIYSTINKALSQYNMIYKLAQELPIGVPGVIEVDYLSPDGNIYHHEVEWSGDETTDYHYEKGGEQEDGYELVLRSPGYVCFHSKGNIASLDENDYIEDNLEITAIFLPKPEDKQKIFNMTRAVWYGGASAGLAGGTRLFLCGNTNENEKALVCWSGLNNPLYFPENSYFYVGNTSEAVTGFGKQSDMLVLFKNNETWFTQYTQNTNITAEDLIDQRVVDLQASAVYFPLVLINPSIGCAYPDTVQLCRNRLVFMGSDKKVYTLVSNNQYNERSIYCVSEMIDRELKGNPLYSACDWNGYYCLSAEDKLYLMDYNSYGYQYISSYSKTEDSNKKIPWYIWEIPNGDYSKIGAIGDTLILSQYFDSETAYANNWVSFCADGNAKGYDEVVSLNDNGEIEFLQKPINCFMQTKLFDFGEPNFYKNIGSVGLSLGYNGGGMIVVTFVTDGGEEETEVYLEDEAEERTANFTNSRILSPAIRGAVRFGVRLECEGNMIVDGATIDYRVTGRAY